MSTAIVIPARYGSTRFPGKPLAEIGGQSMLSRVVDVAQKAAEGLDAQILVATEDERIADHASDIGVMCVMTAPDCPTGSDRALEAINALRDKKPDFVLNLQGDAPFTPVSVVRAMLERLTPDIEVVTPIHQLSWDDLDRLRGIKKSLPFSGTTAIVNESGQALWFSKTIIPAIRKEAELRTENDLSPVCQHIGLYGFRTNILEKFCALPQSPYELLEGLEQLRMLENGIHVQTIMVDIDQGEIQTGIDTPEDLERAEKHLAGRGEAA